MPSIKKNFFYSAFLTSANYIFPLLTFPYVTRVLGVSNYGLCGFIDSIINYFILFSTVGIGVVGIREVACAKRNKTVLSKTFTDLITLNSLFTFVSLIILLLSTFLVPKLYENRNLMFLGAFKVGFNFLLIEWFYKGLEDFRFITIRTLLVKCLYVIGVFCLVKNSEDYTIYYLLSVLMVAVNAIINFCYSQKFISFSFKDVSLWRYLSPLLSYGVYAILTSFYNTFNIAYLGFVSTDVQVGYYSSASRLYAIFIAMVSAFTGVMMPRMSSLLYDGKIEEFKDLFRKSVSILSTISIPIIIFTVVMAPQIISLLAGDEYGGAILPMRIVMPLLFVIGYEQIMIAQGLMPLKKDKTVLKNSSWGAITGITANILIVPYLEAVGSAIVWLICEVLIMILTQIAIGKFIKEKFPINTVLHNLVIYLPLVGLYWLQKVLDCNSFFSLLITGTVTLLYFLLVQIFILPNGVVGKMIRKVILRKC